MARYTEMKDEISGIRARVNSPDRNVTVIAGPGGSVLDLTLTEHALAAASGRALAGSIMSALRLAVADAAKQQAAIVQRYVGDRLNIAERVMATQQEVLGDKIEAGEQEQARLDEQARAKAAEEVLRIDPQQPAPPQARPRPPQRPARTGEDEGFSGLGEGDRW
jgi:DNA-binding protein YbaB